MSRIISVRQARKAIEDQEIKIGTILTDTDGTFQVTAVNPHSDIVIDGVLHRFEFTFELAWKTIKDYISSILVL